MIDSSLSITKKLSIMNKKIKKRKKYKKVLEKIYGIVYNIKVQEISN